LALGAVSHGRIEKTAYGDGLIYRYVATHLDTPPSRIDPVVSNRGTSLRYGRIGFPVLIWIFAAGQPAAIPYSQAILIVLGAGFVGAATYQLLPRAGLLGALVAFMVPGFSLSIVGGYGEVIALALSLWALIEASRSHWWVSASLLSAAMLTRENAGAVVFGMIVWLLLKRSPKPIIPVIASTVPLIAWYVFVDVRFGHIPLLDPYLHATTSTIATPFLAVGQSLTHGGVGSILTAASHLLLALTALWLARRSVLTMIAAAAGLQVFSAGPFAWHYIGDAMRAFVFLESFLAIAILSVRWAPRMMGRPAHLLSSR